MPKLDFQQPPKQKSSPYDIYASEPVLSPTKRKEEEPLYSSVRKEPKAEIPPLEDLLAKFHKESRPEIPSMEDLGTKFGHKESRPEMPSMEDLVAKIRADEPAPKRTKKKEINGRPKPVTKRSDSRDSYDSNLSDLDECMDPDYYLNYAAKKGQNEPEDEMDLFTPVRPVKWVQPASTHPHPHPHASANPHPHPNPHPHAQGNNDDELDAETNRLIKDLGGPKSIEQTLDEPGFSMTIKTQPFTSTPTKTLPSKRPPDYDLSPIGAPPKPAYSDMNIYESGFHSGNSTQPKHMVPRSVQSTPVHRREFFAASSRSSFTDFDPDDWLDVQLEKLKIKRDLNDPVLQRRKVQEKLLLEELKHVNEDRMVARGKNEQDYTVEGIGTKTNDPLQELQDEQVRKVFLNFRHPVKFRLQVNEKCDF